MKPKFNLNDVKRIIISPGHHIFASSTATNPLVATFNFTQTDAVIFIKSQLLLLEEHDFCSSIFIRPNVYDIYGKIIDNILFYIKFTIENFNNMDRIFNISFHPAAEDIITMAGTLRVHRGKDI